MKQYAHVDEWLDDPDTPETDLPAKAWLEKFRAPAWNTDHEWLNERRLTCRFKGRLYRVVGCSAMGDIWLTTQFHNSDPADREVHAIVHECSDWALTRNGHPIDLDSPWRVTEDSRISGCFMPVVVDVCNRPLFSAHAYPGVMERIVADHNATIKPYMSPYAAEMGLDDDDDEDELISTELPEPQIVTNET